MEKIIYFVDYNSTQSCHGFIIEIFRNKSNIPVAVRCSCGEPLHLVIPNLDSKETFTVMSNTKLTKQEVSVLSNERCTIDETVLTF